MKKRAHNHQMSGKVYNKPVEKALHFIDQQLSLRWRWGMSLGPRLLISAIASLIGILLILDGTTAMTDKAWLSYVSAAFCFFIAAASVLIGRAAQFFGSIIGSSVFIAGLIYLFHQLTSGPIWSGSINQPSIINALLFMLFFGIPGVIYTFKARFGFEKKEIHELRLSAEGGDANAQYDLGVVYGMGLGLPLDYTQAREWWLKSAARSGSLYIKYRVSLFNSETPNLIQDRLMCNMFTDMFLNNIGC